jgi:hypothetical protein
MEDKYNLQPNEAVIMKSERVQCGGLLSASTDELLLTNLNIVLVNKGFLGNTKNVQHFPLDQIKLFNGKAQVMVSTQQKRKLEVYFWYGHESFTFVKKKEAKLWAENISKLLKAAAQQSQSADTQAGKKVDTGDVDRTIPGTGFIAETLKDTADTFKGVLGIKAKKVAVKCSSCGSAISGTKGEVVRCQYCDTDQKL